MSTFSEPNQDKANAAEPGKLVDNFFRLEAGRMVSTLTRILGLDNIDLAEDVVQDAMLKALQQWSYGNIPQNPSGWIMQVAKNRALDVLRRRTLFQKKEAEIGRSLEDQLQSRLELATILSEAEIKDDQLRMIFACCHPIFPANRKSR